MFRATVRAPTTVHCNGDYYCATRGNRRYSRIMSFEAFTIRGLRNRFCDLWITRYSRTVPTSMKRKICR